MAESEIGLVLIIIGILILLGGIVFYFGGKMFGLGRLPGDVVIENEGWKIYFPIASSILISIILTVAFLVYRLLSK